MATLASFALLSASGLALAQSTTTVTTTVAGGSRQLAVTDLAGNPLTAMALSPGVPTAFRVRVADSDYLATQGFAVQSTLTNLYRQGDGGYDYATSIPSTRVSVSYPTSPLSLAATAVDLQPDYLLDSAAPIDCSAVATILGLSALQQLTDPLCGLLNTLTGSALSFSDVPLTGTTLTDIDLGGLGAADLPVAVAAGSDAGSYTAPDCVNGIGAAAGCTGSGTVRTYLTGTPPGASLNAALTTLLNGQTLAGPLASADGTGAVAPVSAAVQALQNAPSTAVADFGNTLTQYSGAQQTDLINGLIAAARDTIEPADLAALTGQYHAFPQLSVSPDDAGAG
ncbi:MAG TPA: hypothetical protein VG452_08730, partial [Egibacteraceae bacterium]|nr:hypothetical protein [Egibacteraceae bacterium]